MSDPHLKQRITDLANAMSAGLHEREEHAAVILLAALSGQNIFLLGPPGTAKSLLARRLASVFEGECFVYLMQKFSTPEEIFGPVSIAELKRDRYERKTDGFLPMADFAFLDEIWKAGPGILNTLLTIINEKKFRNGTKTVEVPLKSVISASNETPPDGEKSEGLDALYDRLIVRLYVSPIEEADNFNKMLTEKRADYDAECESPVRNHEIEEWQKEIQTVELSQETKDIIKVIRGELSKLEGKLKKQVYVSDRRWQKAATLLKSAAFFCGRKSTNLADTMLLQHCLWSTKDNRESVMAIVEKAVEDNGLKSEISDASISKEKDTLEEYIKSDLYHTKDVYKTSKIGGTSCHEVAVYVGNRHDYGRSPKKSTLFMPCEERATFCPLNEKGERLHHFNCALQNGRYSVENKQPNRYDLYKTSKGGEPQNSVLVVPEKSNFKGDRKEVSPNMRKHFRDDVDKIAARFDKIISEIEEKKKSLAKEISTPFVPKEKQDIALGGIEKQLDDLRSERESCNRLLALIAGE